MRRLHVLYLGSHLSHPGVTRRVQGMRDAGAKVTAYAFDRGESTTNGIRSLGRAADGDLWGRFASLSMALARLQQAREIDHVTAIFARNLDQALLALCLRRRLPQSVPLIYEVRDLHPLLLRQDAMGAVARRMERFVLRRTHLLVVSSPGFMSGYFAPIQGYHGRYFLLENKVEGISVPERPALIQRALSDSVPFTIVLAGKLRCKHSLRMLGELARKGAARVRVRLAGTSPEELEAELAALRMLPNVEHFGHYRYPGELARVYSDADLNWTLDFSRGRNAELLVPNRLYEGALFGVPPLVRPGTSTETRASDWGVGITAVPETLRKIASMPMRLRRELQCQRERLAAQPASEFLSEQDHRMLLDLI